MRQVFHLFFIFLLFYSCTRESNFPPLKTQKVLDESLTLIKGDSLANPKIENDSVVNSQSLICIDELDESVQYYSQNNEMFELQSFEEEWEQCKSELSNENSDKSSKKKWIEATGLLLQLTAEPKYAEELENVYLHSNDDEIKNLAASYVFTKNVDHLHVNLFVPAKIEYNHSLDGQVEMVQETNYPENGRVELTFGMEKRRYIELLIRIPSWAEDAQVTVKGVKYFAPAGGYCKIAKKWKDGDLVEIIFPGIRNQNII